MNDTAMTDADNRAVLVLEDGQTLEGRTYGASGQTLGEIVFNTGMTGYQETLTDPSYHRQIVTMTAPHIGNTGMNDEDNESRKIWVAGYVVRDPARKPSNWRAQRTLDEDLEAQGVVGISGIDTRQLTRMLRTAGVMRAGIFSGDALKAGYNADAAAGSRATAGSDAATAEELLGRVKSAESMVGAHLADAVSVMDEYVVEPPEGTDRIADVVAVDLGIKAMTPEMMAQRGIRVTVVPSTMSAADILAKQPDGVFFSNGPGDPSAADRAVTTLREILDADVPFFGICFGNQILGRALGYGTYKLAFGHRGINQPVMDRRTRKVEITAHNHGFAVDAPTDRDSQSPSGYGRVRVSHVCLNDDVVEGLECLDIPAFSVQYHPEAAAGPHDAAYLFDRFVDLMASAKDAAKNGARN
ncbi:glutamine-hydrolyzing carbamoyl-phosphate synthase small subunit [Demequina aurantiaca]|uniref:glutamine-hydrolyzing carbamoyl-phosphate synthase small subunit n=1 Tax=Demequina aurantiaca TaxID=676200 RepID=UPI000A919ECE|nr:glutamine-hydrolyzing carbamoyl-phosphate synthase small subunit [Demequina aurantiaca]